jgi:hypothetical protein
LEDAEALYARRTAAALTAIEFCYWPCAALCY